MGYFEQVAKADVFVFLDTVQFVARSWQSRNRLKGNVGEPFWLSVPVAAHPRTARLMDIRISADQRRWRRKHLRSIRMHLGSAPYFESVYPKVEQWISAEYEYLVNLNIAGIKMLSALLQLSPAFIRASELNVGGKRTRLLVNLCKQVGANRYYSSAGSRAYIDQEAHVFAEAGIEVVYQRWQHPIYPQRDTPFVSNLAVIDALMNIGPQATRSLIIARADNIVDYATY
jgi:WbqC-like protein family